ncbi:MAG: hypothetical protein ACYTBP_14715 [Planctomycetota bacterium]
MKAKPMTMLLAMLAGWINRQQQEMIEYLKGVCATARDTTMRIKAANTNVLFVVSIIS